MTRLCECFRYGTNNLDMQSYLSADLLALCNFLTGDGTLEKLVNVQLAYVAYVGLVALLVLVDHASDASAVLLYANLCMQAVALHMAESVRHGEGCKSLRLLAALVPIGDRLRTGLTHEAWRDSIDAICMRLLALAQDSACDTEVDGASEATTTRAPMNTNDILRAAKASVLADLPEDEVDADAVITLRLHAARSVLEEMECGWAKQEFPHATVVLATDALTRNSTPAIANCRSDRAWAAAYDAEHLRLLKGLMSLTARRRPPPPPFGLTLPQRAAMYDTMQLVDSYELDVASLMKAHSFRGVFARMRRAAHAR